MHPGTGEVSQQHPVNSRTREHFSIGFEVRVAAAAAQRQAAWVMSGHVHIGKHA